MRRAAFLAALMVLAPSARAEKILVRNFPNGLKWIHKSVTHNQIAAYQLFIPGGLVRETAKNAGLTKLMAAVMSKGTKNRSAKELAMQVESLGATVGVDAGADVIEAGGQAPLPQLPQAFEIFIDVLLNPTFPPEEFDKEKKALLNDIRTSHEHIFNVADERMSAELFGDHPYGRPDEGTEESVARLTVDDVARWHRSAIQPAGAILVTIGNGPVKMWESLAGYLAAHWLGEGPAPAGGPPPVRYPAAPRTLEDTQSFEQSYFMLSYPAPGVREPGYVTIKVLNALLGSGMSSPLFQSVREEGTLAYEVSSFYRSRVLGSAFTIYAGMDPANLSKAETRIRDVVADFRKKPLSEDDLEDAKRFIRGHYMMDHQTNARQAWYLGWWEYLGKGLAYDTRYPDDIQKVTAADVKAAADGLFSRPAVTVRVLSKKSR